MFKIPIVIAEEGIDHSPSAVGHFPVIPNVGDYILIEGGVTKKGNQGEFYCCIEGRVKGVLWQAGSNQKDFSEPSMEPCLYVSICELEELECE